MVNSGEATPVFKLPSTFGEFEVSQHNQKNIVLVFYPEDDTPVCASQLALYNEILPMIEEHDAQLVGISVDKPKDHEKFAKKLNLRFPLLADSDPRGEVSKLFDVYDEESKKSNRALVVIDKRGTIRWKHISPLSINPGADGILKALEEITKTTE